MEGILLDMVCIVEEVRRLTDIEALRHGISSVFAFGCFEVHALQINGTMAFPRDASLCSDQQSAREYLLLESPRAVVPRRGP